MADNLFQGLPPPSSSSTIQSSSSPNNTTNKDNTSNSRIFDSKPSHPPPPPPPPALKSALKKRSQNQSLTQQESDPKAQVQEAPQKRARFRTSVDASEEQVIQAMQKITSHIKNPSKFSKASKLALQLIKAGSVNPRTSDIFFALLDGAMSSPSTCNEPSFRADYHALFSEVQEIKECFNQQQQNQLTTWTIRAVVANDLYTDDSFVFSKAAGKIKEAICSLPTATAADDKDEADTLEQIGNGAVETNGHDLVSLERSNQEVFDPFGLDVLLPTTSKKEEKLSEKESSLVKEKEEVELKKFVKSQREVLLSCLEIAARRYRIPWAQTVIDILVKHAFDNMQKFTTRQRDAIEKLWASIKEQQIRRKQGKSVTGKLDVNGFEWLQEKYANEKISIRRAVGGGGDRRAQQWLGDFDFQSDFVPETQEDDEVDFVPETQYDGVPQNLDCETLGMEIHGNVDVVEHRSGKEICIDKELIVRDKEIDVIPMTKKKELPYYDDPPIKICHCGFACELAVCRNKKNAGRRFYGCTKYAQHKIMPDFISQNCNFFQWIDPPMCRRSVEYAIEMQAEVIRLDKYNRMLERDNSYLKSKVPDHVLFASERYAEEK